MESLVELFGLFPPDLVVNAENMEIAVYLSKCFLAYLVLTAVFDIIKSTLRINL